MRNSFTTNSVEETISFAKKLVGELPFGSVIALNGDLGAGKTHFVKGLALGLNIDSKQSITSPTFTIINEYDGAMPLYHIDFYRLNSENEARFLGLEEYFDGKGITAVEWANKFPNVFPERTVWINIEVVDENERNISIG